MTATDTDLRDDQRHGRDSIYDAAVADACLRLFRGKGYTIPT